MTSPNVKIEEPFDERIRNSQAIAEVVNRACRRAVEHQSRAGQPAVVWRNGQVTLLQPSDLAKQARADKSNWISEMSGSLKDDPVFDEIVRLGKELRDAEMSQDDDV